MKPLVSIILPVYNVELYLKRTLDSILTQTLQEWECLCIDDGSTDASGAILDEYAFKDARFKVIHQTNAGVSAARNKGLELVSAPYFTFVDSDDWIEPDHLEHLYKLTHESAATIGVVGMKGADYSVLYSSEYDGVKKPTPRGMTIGMLWNKLYRSSAIQKCRFATNLFYGEDVVFLLTIARHVETLAYDLKYAGYHYETHEGSLSHTKNFPRNIDSHWDCLMYLESHVFDLKSSDYFYFFIGWIPRIVWQMESFYDAYYAMKRMGDRPDLWRHYYEEIRNAGNKHNARMARLFMSRLPKWSRAGLLYGYVLLLRIYIRIRKMLGV